MGRKSLRWQYISEKVSAPQGRLVKQPPSRQNRGSRAPPELSSWLGASLREQGFSVYTEVGPEAAANGGCQITSPLPVNSHSKGHLSRTSLQLSPVVDLNNLFGGIIEPGLTKTSNNNSLEDRKRDLG